MKELREKGIISPEYKCCKYCKEMLVIIVEPSDSQYCNKIKKQVKKLDKCEDFLFDEERVEFWKKVDLELRSK